MSLGSERNKRKGEAIRRHNETELSKMKEGDEIKFDRGVFSHWGIYVGNGDVVHVTSEDDLVSFGVSKSSKCCCKREEKKKKEKKKAVIKKEMFWDVAGNSKAYIDNKLDSIMTPLDQSEIVQKALSRLGEIDYSLLFHNCEHFASWCRYGREKSKQAERMLSHILLILPIRITFYLIDIM